MDNYITTDISMKKAFAHKVICDEIDACEDIEVLKKMLKQLHKLHLITEENLSLSYKRIIDLEFGINETTT